MSYSVSSDEYSHRYQVPTSPSLSALSLSTNCELTVMRMQMVADLLLLTSDIRPVNTENVSRIGESYTKCRDTIIAGTKGLAVVTKDVQHQVEERRYGEVKAGIRKMCDFLVNLIECSSHAAYLAAISEAGSIAAIPGIIDRYKICKCSFDIEHCCRWFEVTPIAELSLGGGEKVAEISEHLSTLGTACKLASSASEDAFHKEHFKAAMRSITSASLALFSAVKRYKSIPNETGRSRCVTFSRPLIAACQAFVEFSMERPNTGTPATLSESGKKIQMSILGSCLNVVSSCIQLCNQVRAFVIGSDGGGDRSYDKLSDCNSAISEGSRLLVQALKERQAQYSPRVSQVFSSTCSLGQPLSATTESSDSSSSSSSSSRSLPSESGQMENGQSKEKL